MVVYPFSYGSFRLRCASKAMKQREKKRDLTHLKEVLTGLFDGTQLPVNLNDALIWEVWNEVLDSATAEAARPLYLNKGRLRVGVTDPIWLQELGLKEKQIREALNTKLGRKAVTKIDFRILP